MFSEIIRYRIKNLRSIVDSNNIDIHNLNILVGKNGSGKSTFMRFFQVLSQSLRSQKKVPLLFYGNEVDFGSFEESISKKSSDSNIGFGFEFSIKNNNLKNIEALHISNLKIFCEIEKKKEDVYNWKITINSDDDIIIIYFFNNVIKNIQINNIDFSWSSEFFSVIFDYVIPQIIYKRNINNNNNKDLIYICYEKITEFINDSNNHYSKLIFDILSSKYQSKENTKHNIASLAKSNRCYELYENILSKDENILKLRSFLCLVNLQNLLYIVNESLQELSRNIFYIGPLRYPPQRYYRMSDIDDTRIDQFGANISNFINNLSEAEENGFRQWTYKYFEFKSSKVNTSGIVSIKINQKDEESENLVDVGFGYSQLLPIALQLWKFKSQAERIFKNSNKRQCYIFLIEQPELHLHPAFQRKLLRAIVDVQNECKQNNVVLKVILETHSATIVDELGRITDEELLCIDDSIVYIFNKKNGICDISSAQYDSEGRLINWPPGFFSGD